jgi:hypothetical protein
MMVDLTNCYTYCLAGTIEKSDSEYCQRQEKFYFFYIDRIGSGGYFPKGKPYGGREFDR